MPEPITAAEGEQSVQTATTPQSADKPETTTQSEGTQSEAKSIFDHLDIPEELREQVSPRTEPEAKVEPPEPEAETTEEETPEEVEGKKKKEEPKEEPEEEESEGEEEEDEDKEEKPAEQKIDKRQKRINRLTRQRSRLENDLADRESKIEELKVKLERFEKNGAPPVATVPNVGKWMPDKETADAYTELSQKAETAKATLKWCDKYSQGVTITENGQERFVSPEEILEQRRNAEVTLMDVNPDLKVMEHTAKQVFRQQKANFDRDAVTLWPELSKKDSEIYQEANGILKEFPTIAASPAALYYVGLAIEGRKSIEAKAAAAKNGNGSPQKRRDIDPKVFTTPRVPIAPHTPEPPTRESVPSSQKKIQEAENSFMEDQDGSAESLARVFQARDAAATTRPKPTSLVRS